MFDKLAKAFDKNPFAFIFGAMLTGVLLALVYLAITAPAQAQSQSKYTYAYPTPIQVQVKIPTEAKEPEQTVIATDKADADVCDEPKRCVLIAPKAMGVLMRKLEQLEKAQQKGASCL